VWAAAADIGVPISFHIGTYRADAAREKAVVIAGAQTDTPRPVQTAFSTADPYVRNVLADLVFAGVLERHPGLRVVSAEHEIGWLAHFVERMDYTYTQRATRGLRFGDGALPSDFVRRQVWVQFCEDPLASHAIDVIGAANVLWGTDYPHSEGTFPHSRDVVDSLLGSQSAETRRAVLVDNPARLYGIDPELFAAPAPA
jgi:predicted TIM-barrel fold metal-dependent hydrolase